MLSLRIPVCALLIVLSASALRAQVFTEQSAAVGITTGLPGFGQFLGRGCAWDDFDDDGDQDCFLAEGAGGDYVIWAQQPNGTFLRQVVLVGPSILHSDHAVVSADFDNDGDTDVFVAVGGPAANCLFVNQGGGVFTEEAAARGITQVSDSFSATWGDADRDGWLDLYVGNREGPPSTVNPGPNSPNFFYRNMGDGTFIEVAAAAGLEASSLNLVSCWVDRDENGWPDLIVGNDKGDGAGDPVMMFENQRNGTFVDQAGPWNATAPLHAMGITVADIHNDGGWDVFMTNIPFPGNSLFRWDGTTGGYLPQATWDADATTYGMIGNGNGWGTNFFDADHDGQIDLFFMQTGDTPKLLRGTPTPPFQDVSASSGIMANVIPGYSCCVVDYDDDGDLDIFTPGDFGPGRLMRNDTPNLGNWVQFDLEGTLSNRDGFGALVIVKTALGTYRRFKLSGESYLSDGDKRVHFGLGTATNIDEVEIRWPSGTVQYLANLPVNQRHQVVESSFAITGTLAPGTANTIELLLPGDAFLPYACGLTFDVFSEFEIGDGRSVLVNVNDPLLVLTSTPGNNDFVDSSGFYDVTGRATMTLNVPNLPFLSGLEPYLIGVSWNPNYTLNLKSIIGPQRIMIP